MWPVMHAGKPTPLVNRMTDTCKHITLFQTSFAVGNNPKLYLKSLVTPLFGSWIWPYYFWDNKNTSTRSEKIAFRIHETRYSISEALTAGARSKNSATNHSTFQKKSELFSIGGGDVVPVVNNTTCFSKYKWLLFLLLFSSYFPLLSHSFLK